MSPEQQARKLEDALHAQRYFKEGPSSFKLDIEKAYAPRGVDEYFKQYLSGKNRLLEALMTAPPAGIVEFKLGPPLASYGVPKTAEPSALGGVVRGLELDQYYPDCDNDDLWIHDEFLGEDVPRALLLCP